MLWTITGIGKKGHNPKSVIRHAESVPDWGNEAFGHLARFFLFLARPRRSPLRLRLGQKHAA